MTNNKSLKDFEIYYEEMEKNFVKKKQETKKIDIKKFLVGNFNKAKTFINNVVNKTITPKKKVKKLTKVQQKERQDQQKRAIMGIGLLFVIVSIVYSTAVTTYFVDGFAPMVALAPQVVFGAVILLKAFSKLYK